MSGCCSCSCGGTYMTEEFAFTAYMQQKEDALNHLHTVIPCTDMTICAAVLRQDHG